MRSLRTLTAALTKITPVVALISAVCGSAPAQAGTTFGLRCQSGFQNMWQSTLPYAYDRCDYMVDELDDTDTNLFNVTMADNFSGFTTDDGSSIFYGVDSVALFYVSTHGSAVGDNARLCHWNDKVRALSSNWRFGDNGTGTSIFSQYACGTMKIDDRTWYRWIKPFAGGLRYATGSHDKVYDSSLTDETGEDYADELQDGTTIKWAWFDGNWDTYIAQDVAVFATGTDKSNCVSRKNNMKWQNFGGYSRIKDGSIGYLCGSWITDY